MAITVFEEGLTTATATVTETLTAGIQSLKVSMLDGQDETGTADYTLAAMASGDAIIGVIVYTTKASIATQALRAAGDFTAGAGVLTTAAHKANNSGNQLLVIWDDRTP